MSRQIVLDTETTGLSAEGGDRIIELGCVELLNRKLTGNNLHLYFNPGRDSHEDALKVHGISNEFLKDKPKFAEVVDDILQYLQGAEIIIHNAAFDVGFLDNELSLLGPHYGTLRQRVTVEDSLLLARQRYPGQRNSLDALCRRLGVDNAHRQLHGALLDAQLLAEVYLALTAGQHEIGFGAMAEPERATNRVVLAQPAGARPLLRVQADELAAHAARIESIRKKAGVCLWQPVGAPVELETA